MKNVWIEGAGRMSRPSPGGRELLPRSPFIRGKVRSATTHRSQTVEPSSRARETTARAVRSVCPVTAPAGISRFTA
jgi:hypothetical protein